MKKTMWIIALTVLTPVFVGAVTWQLDSSPFVFSGTGILEQNGHLAPTNTDFRSTTSFNKNIVTFYYTLPIGVTSATLNIHRLSGSMIRAIPVAQGSTSVGWNFEQQDIPHGTYLAVLKYADVEKKITLLLVK